jgi:hypothetical protein
MSRFKPHPILVTLKQHLDLYSSIYIKKTPPPLNKPLAESHGVSPSLAESHGVSRSLVESRRVSWSLAETRGVSPSLAESRGVSWSLAESRRVSPSLAESHRVSWSLAKSRRVSQSLQSLEESGRVSPPRPLTMSASDMSRSLASGAGRARGV